MSTTDLAGDCLVRMPLWTGIEDEMDEVLDAAERALRAL
jgi:hypothetical protein